MESLNQWLESAPHGVIRKAEISTRRDVGHHVSDPNQTRTIVTLTVEVPGANLVLKASGEGLTNVNAAFRSASEALGVASRRASEALDHGAA